MLNGTGQFCTSPGVIVVPVGEPGDRFVARVAAAVETAPGAYMLNATIRDSLAAQLASTERLAGVAVVARGVIAPDGFGAAATVLTTDAATFVESPALLDEHFGPVAFVVRA